MFDVKDTNRRLDTWHVLTQKFLCRDIVATLMRRFRRDGAARGIGRVGGTFSKGKFARWRRRAMRKMPDRWRRSRDPAPCGAARRSDEAPRAKIFRNRRARQRVVYFQNRHLEAGRGGPPCPGVNSISRRIWAPPYRTCDRGRFERSVFKCKRTGLHWKSRSCTCYNNSVQI